MRRFSQRNSLVTLNEINITPLLDLAFVLLIIFVITRPLLEQNIDLKLPSNMGRQETRDVDRRNIRIVEITPAGAYYLQNHRVSLPQLQAQLGQTFRQNPKLIVDIRADFRTSWNNVAAVFDSCRRLGITQFAVRTAPANHS